jgi:branched-chain amino acid aminotransferase
MSNINFNGKTVAADKPVLLAHNRGYRYGDGLFETMKVINGTIALGEYHFERLFTGMSLLLFDNPALFTAAKLQDEIISLCKNNNCDKLARVRLSVFRGNGGLYDADLQTQYIIECWPLAESVNQLNENGLVIDIYPDCRKSCDVFSNLKSANFLLYSMAARYVKRNKLNDCLVLNTGEMIADSTIANVFIIKDNIITTPSLTEGCINGVMRRYLIEKLKEMNYQVEVGRLSFSQLEAANEVFLTNAINGMRWVGRFGKNTYTNSKTQEIYQRIVATIPR